MQIMLCFLSLVQVLLAAFTAFGAFIALQKDKKYGSWEGFAFYYLIWIFILSSFWFLHVWSVGLP